MVLWIGVDDTDSLQGMCTTFLATELVRDLTDDFDLIGYPRLVRLNPNIPWKTRGNAALCVRIGRGRGSRRLVGEVAGRPVFSHARGRSIGNLDEVLHRVGALVERWACFVDPNTNPGFVVLRRPAPQWLYWRAVREVVRKSEALNASKGLGHVIGYKNGRGVIGALASTAWRPHDRTYEVLCYREPRRWGTPRKIDASSVIKMDRLFPSTFNNYDYENETVTIAPHSPCPVLFGIRGDDPGVLPDAMRTIQSEDPDRWLVFETNQGTDDHVSRQSLPAPGKTVRLQGIVSAPPRVLPGGHVVTRVGDFDVTAYEPSKQFRRVVRNLAAGDRVIAQGAIRGSPRTLNLEKLRVVSIVGVIRKRANPRCSDCDCRAKSLGKGAEFRCARCRRRFSREEAEWEPLPRILAPGWYEPPVSARRHLSRPLKRRTEASRINAIHG